MELEEESEDEELLLSEELLPPPPKKPPNAIVQEGYWRGESERGLDLRKRGLGQALLVVEWDQPW